MIFAIVLSVLIAFAHFISDRICLMCSTVKNELISFVAGISIVYVFLNLYPEFYSVASAHSPLMFTSVFLGFAIFHIIDKEIYQKISHKGVKNDIKVAHGLGLVVYYFVVGMVLVHLLDISSKTGFLFFIPVFIYASFAAFSGHSIHGLYGPHHVMLEYLFIFQSFAVIAGTVFALFVAIPDPISIYSTGLVAGLLTYIVLRDMLPKEKKGNPLLFIMGSLVYATLIVWLWFI